MPELVYNILSAICALFIVVALFSDPTTDDQLGLPAIGALVMVPIIALIVAGFAFALPIIISALGILALVLIGLALLFLLWRIVTSNEFSSVMKKLFGGLARFFRDLFNMLGDLIPDVLKFFKLIPKLLSDLWNTIADILSPIWNAIKGVLKALWKILKSPLNALRGLLDTLSDLPGFLGDIFKGIGNVFRTIGNIIDAVFDAMRAVLNTVVGLIKDIFSFLYNMLWDAAPWMRPILKFLLWLLLIPLLLFRRRKKDEKEDDKKKQKRTQKNRFFFIKGSKNKQEFVPVTMAKQVPTVLQGVSEDLLHILNSTHKRIRHIEQR